MLSITVNGEEFWDEEKEMFCYGENAVLELEHSLVAIAEWEAKWNISFFEKQDKTDEMVIDYIRCMTTNEVDPSVYNHISQSNIQKINEYVVAPMTATTIKDDGQNHGQREKITAELIYYWMIALNIPIEFEHWHINRLITLIRVCSEKNKPPKKMNQKDIMAQNRARNAARRAKLHSRG